jgi:hypothetical protein
MLLWWLADGDKQLHFHQRTIAARQLALTSGSRFVRNAFEPSFARHPKFFLNSYSAGVLPGTNSTADTRIK